MKSLDEDVSVLNDLGLNITEAKIYLALAKAGILTVQEASKLSGIVRTHVYRAMDLLVDAGLVLRIVDQPERFQAIPLDEGISTLLHRRIAQTAELQKKTRTLIQNFRFLQFYETPDEKNEFKIIPKKETLYNRAEKMIANTQNCICLSGTKRKMISLISTFQHTFEEALARGVSLRVTLPELEQGKISEESLRILGKHQNFSVRLLAEPPKASLGIYDRKEILLSASQLNVPGLPALWSNNKSLVGLSQDYFDRIWSEAKVAKY